MYPHHFADLLRRWLTDADHPGIAQVQTCADIGRWEQPVGVVVTLSDGWRFLLQTVGTYPDGGAARENPDTPRPEPFDGSWEDRPDYRQARAVFERETKAYQGPRPSKQQATATVLLGTILDVVKRADHPELVEVEVPERTPPGLRVTCDDRSMIYGLAVGFMAPGATTFSHPAHQIPKEWT